MKRGFWALLMMAVLLSACGRAAAPAEKAGQYGTAEELGLPATMELEFVAGEQVQAVPATLYVGRGYSVYIPDSGWKKDVEREEMALADVWESTLDDEVEFAVYHYGMTPLEEAVTNFLEEQDDYVFQGLLLNEEAKEPLEGVDEDGDVLKFLIRAGKEGTYLVSWKYRDAYGSAAYQAEQIARSFVPV